MSIQGHPQLIKTTALSLRASRKLLLRDWTDRLVRVLPWAIGSALLLVVVERRWVGSGWWWGIPLALLIGSAVLAWVISWMRRPDVLSAAGWIDASGHTQSRFRSAMELASRTDVDPMFADLAIAHAEHSAAGTRVPPGDTRAWRDEPRVYWSGLMLVAVVLAGIFIPTRSIEEPIVPPTSPLQIADAQREIENQQRELETLVEDSGSDDELVRQALEDLAALEEELSAADMDADPESSAARAASRVEQLADELSERADRQQLEEQALREKLDALKSESLSKDSELDRFREQLAEGRYEDAMRSLDELEESLDSMTDAQRQQAAEDMESLANAIEPTNQSGESSASEERLESDPDTQSTDQPKPSPAEELSESLKDQARRIREHEAPKDQQEQDQQEQGQPEQSQPEQEQQDTDQPNSDQQESNSREESSPDQSQQTQEQAQEQSQEQAQEQAQEQSQEESDNGQQQSDGEEGSPQEQSESTQNNQSGDQSRQESSESQQPSGENPARQPTQSKDGESKLRKTLQDAQRTSDGAQQDRSKAERVREQLEQSSREDGAEDSSPASGPRDQTQPDQQQLDQQQPDQPNGSSGSEQDAAERDASEQSTQQQGSPSADPSAPSSGGAGNQDASETDAPVIRDSQTQEYVPVQAADDDADPEGESTPVGRWYNPDERAPDGATTSQTAQRFREAARQAREQVDDRRVPRRYRDVIRSYFRQLDERAAELAPSTDGADAPSPAPKKDDG